jgi:hypothetical protein
MDFGGLSEILINKSAETSALWNSLGACDATNGSLIQLLAEQNTLTVVVDDEPTEEMNSIVREVRGALIQDLFASRTANPTKMPESV